MKKSIKCGIVAAVAVAAGFAAYQSYGSYGAQNNNLLMQNVEALAQSTNPNEPDGGDPGSGGSCTHNNPYHTPDRYLHVTVQTAQGTSHKKGQITIGRDGNTYSGDFEKDQTYTVVIETKNCDGIQAGSCCDQRKVGVKVRKV